jgi:hypothetical protein
MDRTYITHGIHDNLKGTDHLEEVWLKDVKTDVKTIGRAGVDWIKLSHDVVE